MQVLGAMEPHGTVVMFKRSNQVQAPGDRKSHSMILEKQPYGAVEKKGLCWACAEEDGDGFAGAAG